MPVYEFKCKSCGHTFKMLIPSASQGTCPKCHSKRLDEQHSNFSANSRKDGSQHATDTPPRCKVGQGNKGDPTLHRGGVSVAC
jgi:putative FmdB family regulatory protein